MLCSNCGKTIVGGAMFCPYCGEKVEKEKVCAQCGAKLLPGAAFCHMCGTRISPFQPCGTSNTGSINSFAETMNAESGSEKTGLPELSELSPYAYQFEYYQFRQNCNNTVLNRNWIVYEHHVDNERMLCIMDVDGNHQNTIMKKRDSGDYLLGVNNRGIWHMCYSGRYGPNDSYPIVDRIIVRGLSGEKIHEFRFNEEGDNIETFYILGGEVFYIAKSPRKTQRIMRMSTECSNPVCIFKGRVGEELSKLSVSATDIPLAFYLESHVYDSKRPSGWIIASRDLKKFRALNHARDKYDAPKTKIFEVFLEQGKMWTEATEEEKKLGYSPNVRVERTIGMPEREPALRVMPRDRSDSYFDGRDLYADDTYRLTRIQPDGTKSVVSYGLHGDSKRYLVNNEYVFVNYDALCPVRLPRKFHTCELPGFENPEAICPWGRTDYRL